MERVLIRRVVFAAVALFAVPAFAQSPPAPPKFVPFVLDEGQFNDIRNYLLNLVVPGRMTYPLVSRLDQLEADAQNRHATAMAVLTSKAPTVPPQKPKNIPMTVVRPSKPPPRIKDDQ